MKIGLGWWGFRELPFEEHLNICNQFGFKILEIGIGDELPSTFSIGLDETVIGKSMSLASRFGIKLPYATVENDFTLTNLEDHNNMIEHVYNAIEQAALFKVSHIRLFVGFMPAEDITNKIYFQVIDAMKRCSQICREYDISISIETHGRIIHKNGIAFHYNTMSTDPKFLERLMRDLPGNVGFNYDPGNIKAVRPADKTYCLDIINERINYCHLKDWKRKQGGWEAVAIGDGDLDYTRIFEKMKFDGIYLIEYEPVQDLKNGISRSLNYLDNIGVNYIM
ncbi:sugar phosphate isomerase/epimerase family protein [Arenibacter troitsensis]|uniref:Sugar phosphate isomerase/epimerase n=1 Tax=Arenibacter troitsensis TaxID=188872 RepID=A0A1X7KHW6_9FLAO|nr:sugar phosphate isomerase/epimerase [Arenibacter troitsensis]SMG40916.1 Sugar phosphate isomerase/epimerase [Arenibacter troitsensis]